MSLSCVSTGDRECVVIYLWVLLFIIFVISAYTDLAHHKVYNWVTIPGIIAGLLLNFAFQGFQGLGNSLLGLIIGGGLFLIFFLMGGMGGGDVKLMGAVGALGGYPLQSCPISTLKFAQGIVVRVV